MALKNIIQAIPLTNIASSTVSSTYQAINSTGLPSACSIIRIINNSTDDVTVSYDGTNDHEYVPKATVVQLSFEANAQPNNFVSVLPIGTRVYVKGTAGTGNIYLSGYFNPSGA